MRIRVLVLGVEWLMFNGGPIGAGRLEVTKRTREDYTSTYKMIIAEHLHVSDVVTT